MRLKLDENMPAAAVGFLLERGHGAVTVRSESLSGAGDSRVAETAHTESRILVTLDKGFAEQPPEHLPGARIVLRPRRATSAPVLELLQQVLADVPEERLATSVTVQQPGRAARVRPIA